MTFALSTPAAQTGWLRFIDARWKIAGVLVLAVAAIVVSSGAAAFLSALIAMGLARSAGVSAGQLLSRLVPLVVMLALLLIWPLFQIGPDDHFWNVFGVHIASSAAGTMTIVIFKAVAIVTLAAALIDTTPLHVLGQGATGLGMPNFFVGLVLLTHRYIHVLGEEFGRLRRALRVRSFRARFDKRSLAVVGNVAGMIFVRGHERAERVHQAMTARGFDGRFRSLTEPRSTLWDIAYFAAALAVAVALVVGDREWLSQ